MATLATNCDCLKGLTALAVEPGAHPTSATITMQAAEVEGVEGAKLLCTIDAPEAREEAVALWAWLRIQWALGLVEAWATIDRMEVSAACRLQGSLCHRLGCIDVKLDRKQQNPGSHDVVSMRRALIDSKPD